MSHDEHGSSSPAGAVRHFVADPGRIETLAADMRAGRLSSEALVTRCLDRIANVETHVRAWRVVDSDRALEDARALDEEAAEGRFRGALHGLPVAIKDVMDVEGLPTRCNSPALQDRAPATADAEVVRALRAAGAVVLGKSHTTEYAFFDPSPARNPHHTDHTPGGSSSGSAAAVACGAVPAATGTQTVASVNRPAAYCGVAAFKPSTGLLSTYGVTPLAPMFDTVGFFGRRVADAAVLFEAVCPAHAAPRRGGATDDRLTVIALDDPFLAQSVARGDGLRRGQAARGRPRSDRARRVRLLRGPFRPAAPLHAVPDGERPPVAAGPARRSGGREDTRSGGDGHGYRRRRVPRHARISDRRPPSPVRVGRGRRRGALAAAPDTAPPGLAWTGDPRYIAPWTALGGPVVSVNVGEDGNGLPIGALLVGAPGTDADFTGIARRLATAIEV